MTRQWRAGRITLAVVLVGFGVLILTYWSTGPLWTASAQGVVGFDEENSLFYATSQQGEERWLHTYRVLTGELVNSRCLNLAADERFLASFSEYDPPSAIEANYLLIDNHWVKRESFKGPVSTAESVWTAGYFVQVCNSYLVTAWDEAYEHSWMNSLPQACQNLAKKVVTAGRVHLRFWDLGTGNPMPELDIALPVALSDGNFSGLAFLVPRTEGRIKVSSNARFVAWEDNDRLAVWETNSHRPLHHYIIMAACFVLALWLAWPRRLKMA
jgi:hypothetical protein